MAKKKSDKKAVKAKQVKPTKPQGKFAKTLRSIGGYFTGAWYELKQVRWPSRRTTWALTLAVILFSAFFVALTVLLDFFFQWLFEQIIV